MRALSFKQPWAWLVFHGKDVDNRKQNTRYRGRIIVHASKGWDTEGMRWLLEHKEALHYENWLDEMMVTCAKDEMPYGALVGEVDITSVMRKKNDLRGEAPQQGFGYGIPSVGDLHRELELLKAAGSPYLSPWFFGPFGYVLKNPQAYEKPIPYKGQLGLFEVKP